MQNTIAIKKFLTTLCTVVFCSSQIWTSAAPINTAQSANAENISAQCFPVAFAPAKQIFAQSPLLILQQPQAISVQIIFDHTNAMQHLLKNRPLEKDLELFCAIKTDKGPLQKKQLTSENIHTTFNGFALKKVVFGQKQFAQATQTVVLLLLNGTFAGNGNSYARHESRSYQAFMRLAANLAQKHAAPVELITFRWSGQLSQKDRLAAGNRLAEFITQNYADQKKFILYTFAHSYGGHIANIASHIISRPINIMIQVAVPINNTIEQKQFWGEPEKFNALYNFYSDADEAQVGSSLTAQSHDPLHFFTILCKTDWEKITSNYRTYHFCDAERAEKTYNINITFNNIAPEHTTIRHYPLLDQLINIDTIIHTYYQDDHDITLDIVSPINFGTHSDAFPFPAPVLFLLPQTPSDGAKKIIQDKYIELTNTLYPPGTIIGEKEKSKHSFLHNLKQQYQIISGKYQELTKLHLPPGFVSPPFSLEQEENNFSITTTPFLIVSTDLLS